eukprot:TRINITY_DN17271_c0_g1_i1.p1 TRINITY_DN17271_c0_g1~~TRINITY_DN17271_c0_g1_i1.p1  ORF type:complete len:599 (-),score=69.22 TRINITY_DN17271_c0_g1_i1:155-1951(-)
MALKSSMSLMPDNSYFDYNSVPYESRRLSLRISLAPLSHTLFSPDPLLSLSSSTTTSSDRSRSNSLDEDTNSLGEDEHLPQVHTTSSTPCISSSPSLSRLQLQWRSVKRTQSLPSLALTSSLPSVSANSTLSLSSSPSIQCFEQLTRHTKHPFIPQDLIVPTPPTPPPLPNATFAIAIADCSPPTLAEALSAHFNLPPSQPPLAPCLPFGRSLFGLRLVGPPPPPPFPLKSLTSHQHPRPRRSSPVVLPAMSPYQFGLLFSRDHGEPEIDTLDNPLFDDNGPIPSLSTCSICLDDVDTEVDPAAWYHLKRCGHSFCQECISEHLRVKIFNGQAHNLTCLHQGCDNTFQDAEVSLFLEQDEILKFRKFLNDKQFFKANPASCCFCPSPDCGAALLRPEPAATYSGVGSDEGADRVGLLIECDQEECGYTFCFHCKLPWKGHERKRGKGRTVISCNKHKAKLRKKGLVKSDRDIGEEESLKWLDSHSQPCPKCGIYVQRMDGCEWIQCLGCRHQFCWNCLDPHDHNMSTHVHGSRYLELPPGDLTLDPTGSRYLALENVDGNAPLLRQQRQPVILTPKERRRLKRGAGKGIVRRLFGWLF